MKLKQLFTDDDAVSPVIGVILMVAITVILAAVIASLVLGLGDEPQTTPSAQFEFDYNGTALEITHNGGQSVASNEIEIRGSATLSSSGDMPNQNWSQANPDTDMTSSYDVSTGNTSIIGSPGGGTADNLAPDYDITVTYVPQGGGDTAPLASDQGPEA